MITKRTMYLARKLDGAEPELYEITEETMAADVGKSVGEQQPRAWRFTPHKGGDAKRSPSNLCGSGYSAVGSTAEEALRLLKSCRGAA